MKKLIIILLLGMFAFSASADDTFINEEEFGNFITYYYLNPQPGKIIPSITYYVNSPFYEKVNSRMSIAHFYASLLKDDDSLLNTLFDKQDRLGTVDSKIFTLTILWLIDNATSKNLIAQAKESWTDERVQNIIAKIQSAPPYNVLESAPRTAEDLDNLWGVFMATGSKEAIKKIISALSLLKEGHGMEIAVGGAARWSLASNAVQHKKVLRILESEVEHASGVTKKLLEGIIIDADTRIGNADGRRFTR